MVQLPNQSPKRISLLTFSSDLNNTTDNQGNHCIFAFNKNKKDKLVPKDNQALVKTEESCKPYIRVVEQKYDNLFDQLMPNQDIK